MNKWSKEQLKEMFGDDIIGQLAFVSGCHTHRAVNFDNIPDGYIVSDEVLYKFAELIVQEMCSVLDKAQWDKGEDWVCADGTRIIPQIKHHFGVEE